MSVIKQLLYFFGLKKKTRCLSSTCLFKSRRDSDWGGDIFICSLIQRPLRADWFIEDCSEYKDLGYGGGERCQ